MVSTQHYITDVTADPHVPLMELSNTFECMQWSYFYSTTLKQRYIASEGSDTVPIPCAHYIHSLNHDTIQEVTGDSPNISYLNNHSRYLYLETCVSVAQSTFNLLPE